MKVKVIREYISEFSNPLKLRKGDIVVIDHSKDKHAGWKFGKINDNEAWIPKAYLDVNGKLGKLNRDYNATELSLKEGQVLEVLYEESGWFWCKTGEGKYGWYPKEATEAVAN
jgi:hypothetical protein